MLKLVSLCGRAELADLALELANFGTRDEADPLVMLEGERQLAGVAVGVAQEFWISRLRVSRSAADHRNRMALFQSLASTAATPRL